MNEETQECVVCNEDCSEITHCRHIVHSECIARSGKEECPMCRQEIKVSLTHREIFDQAVQRNRFLEEERNREAAQEIQQQEDPPMVRRPVLIQVGDREIRWRRIESSNMNIDQLFIELAMLNQAHEREEIQCSTQVLRLLQMVYQARQLSIESNISLRQIFDTILTVFEE
jgi:hypothetical protein